MRVSEPIDPADRAVRDFLLARRAVNDVDGAARSPLDPAAARVDRAWALSGDLVDDPELLQLRALALGEKARHADERTPRRWPRAVMASAMAAAAAVAALLLIGPAQLAPIAAVPGAVAPAPGQEIASGATQRKLVVLPDGSRVTLDVRSSLRIAFSAGARRLDLDRGRAYFDVAHERRPFTVRSNGGETIDLGTRFIVDRQGGSTEVTLIEGKVSIRPGRANETVALKPGEQLRYADGAVARAPRPAVTDALGWTVGRVTFDETPLPEAVAILSRYRAAPIRLADDPGVRSHKVTGVFMARNSAGFGDALAAALALRVETRADGTQILSAE